MKTLKECKDEVATKYFNMKYDALSDPGKAEIIEQVAKLYAREACKEQREICAEAVSQRSSALSGLVGHLIKNAPEPTML